MSQEHEQLSQRLQAIIDKMQKVQKTIKGSQQPASMHELDSLTSLGEEYANTVEQIAQLDNSKKTQNS